MPLVDYASSDEGSENECEVDNKEVVQTNVNHVKLNETCVKVNDNSNCDTNGELFSSLPKPKKTFSFPEDNKLSKLLLNKNSSTAGKKEGVQISVPSVSEFDEDADQPAAKKVKPSAKGTGLFSVLPPPKNAVKQTSKHLVPQAVTKNQVKQTIRKAETNSKSVNNALLRGADDDDDEDDDGTSVGNSFFGSSLEQQDSHPPSEDISCENVPAVESASSFKTDPRDSSDYELQMPQQQSHLGVVLNVGNDQAIYTESAQEIETVNASDNPLNLDEKALQILCGNKKKRHQMPMNIIDLSGEEILPDSKEWLLKQFTEEKRGRSHSHKKTHGPSSQSRRKHQITYLAYQAKEQELELQNQWANNRMSRKQTQSKYGF